jgi:hypothetical protein
MRFVILLIVSFNLCSCMNYAPVSSLKKNSEKITLQDFYSPCCGSCGQRIVIDKLDGNLYTLQVNCSIEEQYSRLCTPLKLGSHKKVLIYKKNKIISEKYYKPIYDTAELKKMYPNADSGEYYDSVIYSKKILPLTSIDSSLIDSYYLMTKKNNCTDKHLRFIKGFVLVEEIGDRHLLIENKKAPFNKKVRQK